MKFIFILTLTILTVTNSVKITHTQAGVPGNSNPPATDIPVTKEQAAADLNATIDFQSNLQKIWDQIFKDTSRKDCKQKKIKGKLSESSTQTGVDGIKAGQPKQRKDIYGQLELGFGNSAFFFDYLDELMLRNMTQSFEAMVNSVSSIPKKNETKGYEDPYTLNKMLSIPILGSPPEEDLLIRMKKAMPSFDKDYWKNSFNAVQIAQAIIINKWEFPTGVADPAKRMIDRFDFNGDGRLSVDELIIAVIDSNKSIYGQNKCKNCLEEIVTEIIDPMFLFADCTNKGKLSAEDGWKAFKFLKRSSNKFNIYLCQSDGEDVRTNALNDFILKAHRAFPGALLREEFRLGILVGYWARQTDKGKIILDDMKSRRTDRWSNPDGKDNACIE